VETGRLKLAAPSEHGTDLSPRHALVAERKVSWASRLYCEMTAGYLLTALWAIFVFSNFDRRPWRQWGHRRDAYDTLGSATSASRPVRMVPRGRWPSLAPLFPNEASEGSPQNPRVICAICGLILPFVGEHGFANCGKLTLETAAPEN
jgi:hypothetical protein